MAETTVNDIKARVHLIHGQVRLLERILMDDDCPKDRWGVIDFCTKSVLMQLTRLNTNLDRAASAKAKKEPEHAT